MANSYYYLIAGFPDLSLEHGARGFDHLALKQQVAGGLQAEDLPLWEAMYFPYDNANLLNLLLSKGLPFSPLGKFTQQELEEELRQPTSIPPYMRDFIGFYDAAREAKNDAELTPVSLETKLLSLFYAYAESLDSKLVRRWYAFDRRLRNVQTALLNRRLKKEPASYLIGSDSVADALGKSMAADFGLKGEVDGIEQMIQLFENRDIISKEWKLDELRWAAVEEYTAFDYFTLDRALSFAVKLQLVDRWVAISKEAGVKKLQAMLGGMRSALDTEKTLT